VVGGLQVHEGNAGETGFPELGHAASAHACAPHSPLFKPSEEMLERFEKAVRT
jgi:hypothetical protein